MAPMVEDVVAEIVATVLEVTARPGHRVAVGDTLMLLDSMKMEIPIESPAAGIVGKLSVREGDSVDEGQTVALVDPAT